MVEVKLYCVCGYCGGTLDYGCESCGSDGTHAECFYAYEDGNRLVRVEVELLDDETVVE